MEIKLTLLKEARSLAKSGSYKESARLFADYLEKENDDDPQILLELGFTLLLAGDEDGALRIYEALSLIMSKIKNIPARLGKLWHKYDHLIGGTKRKLVLTGVTAALLSGTACGSQPPVHSSHRYSGGVLRPTIEEQMKPEKPVTSGKTEAPSINMNDLRPYSGHKYSGGVLSSEHLQHIHGLIEKEGSTKPSETSTSPSSTPSEQKTTSADGTAATTTPKEVPKPVIKPSLPDFDLKPISAHRYSGGVYMNFRSQPLKEKSVEVKPLPEDDK